MIPVVGYPNIVETYEFNFNAIFYHWFKPGHYSNRYLPTPDPYPDLSQFFGLPDPIP
jgi:hypothetical protein